MIPDLPHPITLDSFCKGRTLHSFVRDPKISLDINKTRQIAQEIIKVKGVSPALPVCGRGVGWAVFSMSVPESWSERHRVSDLSCIGKEGTRL